MMPELAHGRTRMLRLCVFILLAAACISGAKAFQTPSQSTQEHVGWVAEALKRIETIKPGMTRETLLTVFTTEGGISTRLQRTYVSRECPYFKVDVEFQAADPPSRDGEDARDIIIKISRPYLQFSISD
jgi:hypothetical protein